MGWHKITNNKTGEIVENICNGVDITEPPNIFDNTEVYDSNGNFITKDSEVLDTDTMMRLRQMQAEQKKNEIKKD